MKMAQRAVLLGALFVASCANRTVPIDSAQVWAMYQRTADHNAVILRKEFALDWTMDLGGQINGGMALSGDVLFTGTLDGNLYAIDARKHSILWYTHVRHALMSTPVIYNGLVFVGSGTTQIPSSLRDSWSKKKIVMGVPDKDAIYAYDAATGHLRWSFHTEGEDMPSAVVYRGMLVFANGDFHAYALDAMTGRLIWKRELPGIATMGSATLADGRVFVSTCDYRFPYRCQTEALDPATGNVLWQSPYGDADSSPAYANRTVFVSGLDYAAAKNSWPLVQQAYAVIAALDARSGKPKWIYRDGTPQLPSDVGTSERAVAGTYADGKYFQSLPGSSELVAFDARSGGILWRFRSLAPIKMSPLYYRKRIYAGGNAGVLYVLNAESGSMLRIRTFRQPFTAAPPIFAGDTLLLAQNRFVHAIPLQTLSGSATLAPAVKDKVQRWTQ
jgi:outer membrane protein assembly factor BamB